MSLLLTQAISEISFTVVCDFNRIFKVMSCATIVKFHTTSCFHWLRFENNDFVAIRSERVEVFSI